jgi:hypothetical protein
MMHFQQRKLPSQEHDGRHIGRNYPELIFVMPAIHFHFAISIIIRGWELRGFGFPRESGTWNGVVRSPMV